MRYDAGRFGSGYTDRPKSDASIRAVPMAEPIAAAMARRLAGCSQHELVFCGPGGSNGVPRGTRSRLSVGSYRRVYRLAVTRAELPELDPHGPHDLRHTFATWLEDGAVPARVIEELMGHQASFTKPHEAGSSPELEGWHVVVREGCRAELLRICCAHSAVMGVRWRYGRYDLEEARSRSNRALEWGFVSRDQGLVSMNANVSQKAARISLAPQALGSSKPQYHRPRSGARAAGWAGSPAAKPWPRKRACTSATSARCSVASARNARLSSASNLSACGQGGRPSRPASPLPSLGS